MREEVSRTARRHSISFTSHLASDFRVSRSAARNSTSTRSTSSLSTHRSKRARWRNVRLLTSACRQHDHALLPLRLTTDTVCNEDLISKVAKGKLFASEYNLLTYKFVFQLALKKGDQYFVDNIQCETDLITDREFPSLMPVACSTTNTVLFLEKKVKNVIGKKPVASKVASKTPGAKSRRRARKPASPVKTLKRLKVIASATPIACTYHPFYSL